MEFTKRRQGQEEEESFQVTFLVRGPHALTEETMTAVIKTAVASDSEGFGSRSSNNSSGSSINGVRAEEAEEEEGGGVRELGLNEGNNEGNKG